MQSKLHKSWHPFSRSYGVILPSSLTRVIPLVLWFSHRLPVSVCGTGTWYYLAAFLASVNSWTSLLIFTPHHHLGCTQTVLHSFDPSWFRRTYPSARIHYPPVSLHWLLIVFWWYWNIYQLAIAYAFRPQLRSRLTLGGQAFPRKPKTFDGIDSHYALATHAGILSCLQSTTPYDIASARKHCSSTNLKNQIPKLRCMVLAPLNLRRTITRPVSYYALFKCVAASKPTSWLSKQ